MIYYKIKIIRKKKSLLNFTKKILPFENKIFSYNYNNNINKMKIKVN